MDGEAQARDAIVVGGRDRPHGAGQGRPEQDAWHRDLGRGPGDDGAGGLGDRADEPRGHDRHHDLGPLERHVALEGIAVLGLQAAHGRLGEVRRLGVAARAAQGRQEVLHVRLGRGLDGRGGRDGGPPRPEVLGEGEGEGHHHEGGEDGQNAREGHEGAHCSLRMPALRQDFVPKQLFPSRALPLT